MPKKILKPLESVFVKKDFMSFFRLQDLQFTNTI